MSNFQDAKLVGAMTNLKSCSGECKLISLNNKSNLKPILRYVAGAKEAKLAAATRTKCLAQIKLCNTDIAQVRNIGDFYPNI